MAEPEDPAARAVCPPCRGTGTVVSNLGGAPSEEPCPWCGGTGHWEPGVDAQARFKDGQTTEDAA